MCLIFASRYLHKAPTSWSALTTSFFVFVIMVLVGYMSYGAAIHIKKVEDDFHEMEGLKVQAEAADVAKSQVRFQFLFLVKYLTPCFKVLDHLNVDVPICAVFGHCFS